jgi:two-component system, NarL family, response regulator
MRLAIVEDNAVLREKLAVTLNGEADITLDGAFGTAEEALGALKNINPEVMLVDIGLPDMSGVDLIRQVKEQFPAIEIIAHTVFDDRDTVFSALKAGASGYILKGCRFAMLVDALQDVYQGGAPMSPPIARKVLREVQGGQAASEEYLVTPREKDILKEIESGMTYKEIGEKYSISSHTVNTHIKNIYRKLQATDRRQALLAARKKGIL